MYNILDRSENACAAAYMHWTHIVHDSITVDRDSISGEYVVKHELHCPMSELLGQKYDKAIMETRSDNVIWALFLMYKKWIKHQMANRVKYKDSKDPEDRNGYCWTVGLSEIEEYGRILTVRERVGEMPKPPDGSIPRYRKSWDRHYSERNTEETTRDSWRYVFS